MACSCYLSCFFTVSDYLLATESSIRKSPSVWQGLECLAGLAPEIHFCQMASEIYIHTTNLSEFFFLPALCQVTRLLRKFFIADTI